MGGKHEASRGDTGGGLHACRARYRVRCKQGGVPGGRAQGGAGEALTALYKTQPSARKAVESAVGYAAFSNFGMKIFVAGGGSGKGIAVNNKTKAGDKGSAYQGAVAVAPGVWLYQLTGDGLALELTAKGTKYYKDGDLN
jgi:hypothetical protein